MKVLDIGCGWGSFAKYAAEKIRGESCRDNGFERASRVGTNSKRRTAHRNQITGLPGCQRKIRPDRIGGMIEHVGYKNYRTYMEVVRRCLDDDGLFLLHTIGGNTSVKSWIRGLTGTSFPTGCCLQSNS